MVEIPAMFDYSNISLKFYRNMMGIDSQLDMAGFVYLKMDFKPLDGIGYQMFRQTHVFSWVDFEASNDAN